MKKLKGISPLVAVIMLIAFTLIVAGILAGWATQFARQQQTAIQRCVDARVMLQRGIYNSDTKTLTLIVYNYGRVPLDFNVLLDYPMGIEKYPDVINTSADKIVTFIVKNVTTDLDTVTIRSKDCDPPCYYCPGAQDLLLNIDIRGLL